jgi:hypothetical protein
MKELNEISQKSPFKVPDNYFEEVKRKIITSTADQPLPKEKGIYRKLRPYLAAAATVAVLTLITIAVTHIITPAKSKQAVPEITLNEFSDNYLNDIDLLTLEEKAGNIEPDLARINITSKDIIDYLMMENVEIIDLYEQL